MRGARLCIRLVHMKPAVAAILFLAACPGPSDASTSSTSASSSDESSVVTFDVGSTGEQPTCYDPSASCDRAVASSADFCSGLAFLASTYDVQDPYQQVVVDMCNMGEPACEVCFNLDNYCMQVGENCPENLIAVCACVAHAFGVVV